MELKFNQEIPIEEAKKSSNRTFMELKSPALLGNSKAGASSNRTFMELKFCCRQMKIKFPLVLIAPLWN